MLNKKIISISILFVSINLFAISQKDFEYCNENKLSRSCYNISKYYKNKNDLKEEIRYLIKAKDLGFSPAIYDLGIYLLNSNNKMNNKHGLIIFKQNFERSGIVSKILAYIYIQNNDFKNNNFKNQEKIAIVNAKKIVNENNKKSISYFEKAYLKKELNSYDKYELGMLCLKEKEMGKAFFYLSQAEYTKDNKIKMKIAILFLKGKFGMTKDVNKAKNILNDLASSGYKPAILALKENNLIFINKQSYEQNTKKFDKINFNQW